jgi:PhnB protein
MTGIESRPEAFQPTITATLSVRNGAAAVEFYKSAFGAAELYRVGDGTGLVAQLSVAGATFWVADESPEHSNFSPESLGGCSVRMLLIVEDPDAACARAIAAGAATVVPVASAHGWRLGRILDPFGHHWEVGRPLADHAGQSDASKPAD